MNPTLVESPAPAPASTAVAPGGDATPSPEVPRRRASWGARSATGAGVALAILTGRDGTPAWQAVRAGVVLVLAFVLVRTLRRPGRWTATAAATGGTLAFAAGAGIGGPHAAKVGVSVPTVVGLVAALGALGVLGAAARLAWRRHAGWRRLGLVPTALVVALVAGVVGIPVAATNVPRTAVGSTTPADHGIAYVDVDVPTADGVRLDAWYVPPGDGPAGEAGAAVVVLHGAGSTRSSVLDHAVVLARHGYGVLLVDARGHGGSDGRAMDFGWYGDLDVGAAVGFLAARPEVDSSRIAALGLSMGGEEALGALATDAPIAAVVAEGVTGRTAADDAWLSDVYGARGWVQERIESLLHGVTDLLTDAGPPTSLRDAVARSGRPVLLVTAGDVPDEGHVADWLRDAAPDDVTTWEVPGAGHTDGLRVQPGDWEARVTAFLAAALDVPAPEPPTLDPQQEEP